MAFTPGTRSPLLVPNLAGHVPHNQGLIHMDRMFAGMVISYKLAAAPATPAEYDMHIVAPSGIAAGDLFEDYENHIAIFYGGQWNFIPPSVGQRVWVLASVPFMAYYTGTSWSAIGAGIAGRKSGGSQSFTATFEGILWETEIYGDADANLAKIYTHPFSADEARTRVLEAGIYRIELGANLTGVSSNVVGSIGIGINSSSTAQDGSIRSGRMPAATNPFGLFTTIDIALSADTDVYPLASDDSGTGDVSIPDEQMFFRIWKLA